MLLDFHGNVCHIAETLEYFAKHHFGLILYFVPHTIKNVPKSCGG